MSPGRPGRCTKSSSPEHEFPAPRLAMSPGRRCCATSTSPLTFPQPPQPLPCYSPRNALRNGSFDFATASLKTANAFIIAAIATLRFENLDADCDLDVQMATRALKPLTACWALADCFSVPTKQGCTIYMPNELKISSFTRHA